MEGAADWSYPKKLYLAEKLLPCTKHSSLLVQNVIEAQGNNHNFGQEPTYVRCRCLLLSPNIILG